MDRLARSFRLGVASALLLGTSTLSEGVKAEEDYRITNDVVLRGVRVSPVKPGSRAQITFLLENRSTERILFGGITVTDAQHSRIVASLGNGATTTLDSIPVASGDVLAVDGEALWIEVEGFAKDPQAGGTIKAAVHFGTAVIPVSLAVDRRSGPSS
jgi:hypothetical protein